MMSRLAKALTERCDYGPAEALYREALQRNIDAYDDAAHPAVINSMVRHRHFRLLLGHVSTFVQSFHVLRRLSTFAGFLAKTVFGSPEKQLC